MALEIERKYLVKGDTWRTFPGERLCQGYLNQAPVRTVRVRVAGQQAWLTIKGANQGATRLEFEYPIPVADAEQLLALCEPPLIDKIRRRIAHGGLVWEVDEFLGANAGLVVAEVELTHADQAFDRPDWVGDEVTHDARYFNSQLVRHPYSQW